MSRGALCAVLLLTTAALACRRSEPAPRAAEALGPTRTKTTATPNPSIDLAYVCPMDREIRSNDPGTCPRCGMALVAGVPDITEYHLDMTVTPTPVKPREHVRLTFAVSDPWKDRPVEKFIAVHEKLFHAFIISRDLEVFIHDHPVWDNGVFRYDVALPKPGMYRVLGDFYPEAASPQLITDTIFVTGDEAPGPPLTRDYSAKSGENLKVELLTPSSEPVAGVTAQLRFIASPGDGLQKYLGAWGHMLAASDDLIDMIHTHPFIADGSPEMQFTIVFPRPRVHRVWVQFQRNGIVNTAHFDVSVAAPPAHAASTN